MPGLTAEGGLPLGYRFSGVEIPHWEQGGTTGLNRSGTVLTTLGGWEYRRMPGWRSLPGRLCHANAVYVGRRWNNATQEEEPGLGGLGGRADQTRWLGVPVWVEMPAGGTGLCCWVLPAAAAGHMEHMPAAVPRHRMPPPGTVTIRGTVVGGAIPTPGYLFSFTPPYRHIPAASAVTAVTVANRFSGYYRSAVLRFGRLGCLEVIGLCELYKGLYQEIPYGDACSPMPSLVGWPGRTGDTVLPPGVYSPLLPPLLRNYRPARVMQCCAPRWSTVYLEWNRSWTSATTAVCTCCGRNCFCTVISD